MTAADAAAAVQTAFARPVVVLVARHRLAPRPAQLGATARVAAAIGRALAAPAGTRVRLPVQVKRGPVTGYVRTVARRFDRKVVDAELVSLRNLRPFITKERPGRALQQRRAVAALVAEVVANRRGPVRFVQRALAPKVTRAT